MAKRFWILIMIVCLLLCGCNGHTPDSDTTAPAQQGTVDDGTENTTPEDTFDNPENTTEAPTDPVDTTEAPTEPASTESPIEDSTTKKPTNPTTPPTTEPPTTPPTTTAPETTTQSTTTGAVELPDDVFD